MATKTLKTQRSRTSASAPKGGGQSQGMEVLSCQLPNPLGLLGAAGWPGGEKAPGLKALVAECIDEEHPSLKGRVRVRWTEEGAEQTLWVAALRRLAIRKADRVLMIRPANWPEPLVVGVVDGFERRMEAPAVTGATVVLKADEAVRVRDCEGREILEIATSEEGPTVKLLQRDVAIEMPGNLSLKADQVELTARAGPVIIKASDDVVCQGEMIRLN